MKSLPPSFPTRWGLLRIFRFHLWTRGTVNRLPFSFTPPCDAKKVMRLQNFDVRIQIGSDWMMRFWLMFLYRPFRKCSWLMFRAHDQCCWGVSTATPASWRNLVWWILTIDTELSTKLENINITFWGPWRCMNMGERKGNLMHLVTQCHRISMISS